ncbi:MAG: DUF4131 domain-containing protein [Acidobacteriota bacterium]|nr:DUF4131 domain-containing protein [Acidobacteriota bacterium]
MIAPAVPAAIATLVGVWTDLWFPWPLFAARMVAVAAWAVAAAARGGRPAVVASLLVAGFWASGVLLGTTHSQAAAETPLARWFAEQSGADVGRVGPIWLEGRLRADASPTDYGAALDLAAMWVGSPGPGRSVSGGLRLSVGGELASTRIAECRAGRIIRVSATLRSPPAYRNPGQPDQERRRALGSIVLLGSVKSALLVDVVRRGSVTAELAARVRAWVRRGVDHAVGRTRRPDAFRSRVDNDCASACVRLGARASTARRLGRARHSVRRSGGGGVATTGAVSYRQGAPPRQRGIEHPRVRRGAGAMPGYCERRPHEPPSGIPPPTSWSGIGRPARWCSRDRTRQRHHC